MEDKIILIHTILERHILTENFYTTVLNVFHKEYNIDLFTNNDYESEISAYKHVLRSKLTQYLGKIYTFEELSEMALDNNSALYYRMLNEEYKGVIAQETRVFSADLREKFARDGISKKSFLQTLWQSIANFLK